MNFLSPCDLTRILIFFSISMKNQRTKYLKKFEFVPCLKFFRMQRSFLSFNASLSYFTHLIFKAQQTFLKDYYHSAPCPLWVKLVIYSLYALLYRQNRSPIYQHFSTSHQPILGFVVGTEMKPDNCNSQHLFVKSTVFETFFKSLASIVKK